MSHLAGLLSYVAFLLLAPLLLFHRKLREGRWVRFGHYPEALLHAAAKRPIWLHGASAGDVLALLPTAVALKRALPHVPILATTLTNSGHAMARRHPQAFDYVAYSPWDLPHLTRRAVRRLRPRAIVLEYTELWPQLLQAARAHRVPTVLHNGRFGRAHLGRYRLLFALTGNLLRRLDLLLLRDDAERERALRLGAAPDRALVSGNTKFDNVAQGPCEAEVAALRAATGFAAPAPIFVAGSTHDGEEEPLLRVFASLRQQLPALRLVLAPRYPERTAKLLASVQRRGLRGRLRSASLSPRPVGLGTDAAATTPLPAADVDVDVFLLDSLGELRAAYALATAVFVGGSFVARGGQNILEPAACGKPVLFGPFMDNFVDSVGVLLGRGGVQVHSYAQLERVLADWLRQPERSASLGRLAQRQVRQVSGAAARNAAHIAALCAKAI